MGSPQWNERRPLAIDVDGNHGQIVSRRQEVQRYHDSMIELPLLRVGEVAILHHRLNQLTRELRRSGHAASLDPEPRLVLYRSLVALAHADTDRRHVVHEEVGKVL